MLQGLCVGHLAGVFVVLMVQYICTLSWAMWHMQSVASCGLATVHTSALWLVTPVHHHRRCRSGLRCWVCVTAIGNMHVPDGVVGEAPGWLRMCHCPRGHVLILHWLLLGTL